MRQQTALRNTTRWRHEEYDQLWKRAESELDPVKRALLLIPMNDLLVQNVVVVPLVWRSWMSRVGSKLKGTHVSGWDSSLWNSARWYKEG